MTLVLGLALLLLAGLPGAHAQPNTDGLAFTGDAFGEASNPTLSENALTVELWVKHTGESDTDAVLVSNRIDLDDGDGYVMHLDGDGEEVHVAFRPGTQNKDHVVSETSLEKGRWYHVAGTYEQTSSGSSTTLFINGAEDASTTQGDFDSINNENALVLGSTEDGSSNFFRGGLDDVRIWNEALSAIEISANLNSELPGSEEGLAAYFKLNEASGSSFANAATGGEGSLVGEYALSAPGSIPPVAPIDVHAAPGDDQVTVHFERPDYAETSVSDYTVYRTVQGGSRQQIATVGSGQRTYTDTDVSQNTLYFYEVTATTEDSSESDYSERAHATVTDRSGLRFAGNENVEFDKTASLNDLEEGTEIAVDLWLKFEASSETDAVVLANKSGFSENGYLLRLVGEGAERRIKFEPGSDPVTSETALVAGQWYHVAATYSDANGSTSEIFINGTQDASNTSVNFDSIDSDDPLVFGSRAGAGNFLTGAISDVRLWSTTSINPEELISQPSIGNEEGLIGYWRFDEPEGSSVIRSSARPVSAPLPSGVTLDTRGPRPASPIALRTRPASGNVEVHFQQPEYTQATISEYGIYRTEGTGERQQIATISEGQTTYTDRNIESGTLYFYEVVAATADGRQSDFSTPEAATAYRNPGGNALQLSGTNSSVNFGQTPSLKDIEKGTAVGVDFWMKFEAESDADAILIGNKNNIGSGTDGFSFHLVGDGAERQLRFEPGSDPVTSEATLTAGQWYHVAATYSDANTSTTEIFINGAKDASNSTANFDSINNDNPLVLGSSADESSNFFQGTIDEVRLWKTAALTPSSLTDQILIGNEENLVGYWRLNEPTGSGVARSSAKPLSGTISNGTFVSSDIYSLGISVTGAQPAQAAPGATVQVYGQGFSDAAADNAVSIGSTPATVTSAGATVLSVEVPEGPVGPMPLTVETDTGQATLASGFTRLAPKTDRTLTAQTLGLEGVRNGSVALGDLNGDNMVDVAIVGETAEGTPTTRLYENEGGETFSPMEAGLSGVRNGSVALGDLNGNNMLDLAIVGESASGTPVTRIYRNNRDGSFSMMADLTGLRNGSVALGDLNGDNMLDLAIVGENASGTPVTRIYGNDGDGSFSTMADLTGVRNGSVALGDLNGDNRIDVATVGETADGTPIARLYSNDGSGSFSTLTDLEGVQNSSVALGDLDGDNHLDVATVGENADGTPVARLYSNDGSGSFTPMDADLEGVRDGSVALGDLDGDNHLDVAVGGLDASGTRTLAVYRNEPDGWTAVEPGPIGFFPVKGEMAWGDTDRDGDLDLAVVGETDAGGPGAALMENVPGTGTLAAAVQRTVSSDGPVDFEATGADLTFSGTAGSGVVTVEKFDDAPGDNTGIGETNTSEYRFELSASEGLSFTSASVRLDVSTLGGIDDASAVTMYARSQEGVGSFQQLATSYDAEANELVASTEHFSEFVLASDDSDNPLPVELAGFEATLDDEAVSLTWTTASETNNAEFQVQRRMGERANGRGGAWTTVGSVEGSGTTSQAQSYRFTDGDLPYEADALTYRLRQVDTDGSAHLSETITVERGVKELQLLGTYPNPARQRATVRYALPDEQKASIRLYDVLGRQVRTVLNEEQEGRHERTLDVDSLPSGVYFLRLRAGGETRTQKLTVVR